MNNLLILDTYFRDLQYTNKIHPKNMPKYSGYIMLYHPVSYVNIKVFKTIY